MSTLMTEDTMFLRNVGYAPTTPHGVTGQEITIEITVSFRPTFYCASAFCSETLM
jgi:hypothetical protein